MQEKLIVEVTPIQSEILQRLLFINGFKWNSGIINIMLLDYPYLIVHKLSGNIMASLKCVGNFESRKKVRLYNDGYDDISFKDFLHTLVGTVLAEYIIDNQQSSATFLNYLFSNTKVNLDSHSLVRETTLNVELFAYLQDCDDDKA